MKKFRTTATSTLRFSALVFMGIALFGAVSFVLQKTKSAPVPELDANEKSERIKIDSSGTSIYYNRHKRAWVNFEREVFTLEFKVPEHHALKAADQRNKVFISNQTLKPWSKLYGSLYDQNKNRLQDLKAQLWKIKTARNLSPLKFAEAIVSFIQDIPYAFILGMGCQEMAALDPEIKKLLDQGTPCFGNIKYGLYSSIEFMSHLRGDCDTRSLTLYNILRSFGYDVIILTSDEYAHAVIAINLPLTGTYYPLAGKKYYLWETTNIGFKPGQIPPSINNINYWDLALPLTP